MLRQIRNPIADCRVGPILKECHPSSGSDHQGSKGSLSLSRPFLAYKTLSSHPFLASRHRASFRRFPLLQPPDASFKSIAYFAQHQLLSRFVPNFITMYHHHHQPSYNPYAAPNPPQYASQYGGTWKPEHLQPNGSMNADSFSSSFQRSASYGPQFQPYQQYAYPQSVPPQQQHHHQHHHARTSSTPVPPPFQRHDSHQDPSWCSSGRNVRRTSVQQRWDEYINSEACTDAMQGADQSYISQVTAELEMRALSDERLNRQQQAAASQPPTPGCAPGASPDFLAAQAAERERRLKWAQDMIINNPALCAEVYFAMSKPPASAAAGAGAAGATGDARSPGTASAGGRSSSSPESMGSRTSSYSNSPT
ncbi:uncharacterized protein IWZ02DRAFT_263430 [Phyllosticta citriasiana]|uniref:uncharacterized protein n=1 Tax=Phyllosticta citriasiana TaxID=595635 RepID=UPI0030FD2856